MTARSRLHNRRFSEVFRFGHLGQIYTVSVGRYGDGRIGEVFLDCGKSGTQVQTHARDGAVILSLLLQHGCAIETIRHALTRNPDGSAMGPFGELLDLIQEREGKLANGELA